MMENGAHMHVAIVGGGAAGCFAAILVKRQMPHCRVTVLESGSRPLAKVSITGGGRCNLTNSFAQVSSLSSVYPRGERLMKRLLRIFDQKATCRWFEQEGVRLLTQEDECVFPVSQDAMEIVDTLLRIMRQEGVSLKVGHRVSDIMHDEGKEGYRLRFADESIDDMTADRVIVAIGGCPQAKSLDLLKELQLEIVPPVPSLFSLCIPHHPITQLMGIVTEDVAVGLAGTRMKASGPLLITHWGMSGPAILKLSSYTARYLSDGGYKARLLVNWMGDMSEKDVEEHLVEISIRNRQKQIGNTHPDKLNARLWQHILAQAGLHKEQRWAELAKKSLHKLAVTLTQDLYPVDGKCKFKEEFVTCGGVSLNNVHLNTLECKRHHGIYIIGEALDVDAVTGGFNLQAAWTMGYVAARDIVSRC